MAIQIDRSSAKLKLCKESVTQLSKEERESHILNWWVLDEDDIEYHELSAGLQKKLHDLDEPDNPLSSEYDPLIVVALRGELFGVTNAYLAERLQELTKTEHIVVGDIENALQCPCCDYLTLRSKDGFEVCPWCDWGYTGEMQDGSNGPNHMSLLKGRAKFEQKNVISAPWHKAD